VTQENDYLRSRFEKQQEKARDLDKKLRSLRERYIEPSQFGSAPDKYGLTPTTANPRMDLESVNPSTQPRIGSF
jgi:hypothetical protein